MVIARLACMLFVVVLVAGCASGTDDGGVETGTVYASLPAHGPYAPAGAAAEIGLRSALAKARRNGEKPVRLVVLPSTRAGGASWDADLVRANARRAVADPRAIAYVGELVPGATTASLPITNRAGLLQVAPSDGLTSLGRALVYGDRDVSQRYYPSDELTLARFVPPDLDVAREIAAQLDDLAVERLAVLGVSDLAGVELARLTLFEAADQGIRTIRVPAPAGGGMAVAATVARVRRARPDAVLYTGPADAAARAVLAALARRIGDTPVIGGPQLAATADGAVLPRETCAWSGVPTPRRLAPRGRAIVAELGRAHPGRGADGLIGYAAMRLVLNASARGGANRARVVAAARASVDRDEVVTGYGFGNRAHYEGASVACLEVGRVPEQRPDRARRLAAAFAPLLVLHPRERAFPMSAARFLERSTLKWEDGPCLRLRDVATGRIADRKTAAPVPRLDPARLGGRDREPYRRRPLRPPGCDRAGGRAYASDEHTRHYDRRGRPSGLGLGQGFYLDLLTASYDGDARVVERDGSRIVAGVPAYYEVRRAVVMGGPGLRLVYWLFYGYSEVLDPKGERVVSHEGDWERIEVLARRRPATGGYRPVAMVLRSRDRRRTVRWRDLRLVVGSRGERHPTLYVARGSHTPYPAPGRRRARTAVDGRSVVLQDETAACGGCPRWRTWERVLPVRRQPWYGYGGGWGFAYDSGDSSGPLGPSRFAH